MNSAIEQFSAQAEAFNRVAPLELSVIIPTYRERDNIAPVLAAWNTLFSALVGKLSLWTIIHRTTRRRSPRGCSVQSTRQNLRACGAERIVSAASKG